MPVETYSREVLKHLTAWDAVRDVLSGPRAIKARGVRYLPRLPGQKVVSITDRDLSLDSPTAPPDVSVDLYENYKRRAVVYDVAKPVVSRLLGMIFRKCPRYELEKPNATPQPDSDPGMTDAQESQATVGVLQAQADNLTLTAPAQSAEQFAKTVTRENLETGHGCIVVDFDDVEERPFQRMYAAGSIVSWSYARVGAASWLDQIVLKECVTEHQPGGDEFTYEDITQYRVISLRSKAQLSDTQIAAMLTAAPDTYPLGYVQHQLYREEQDANGKRTGKGKYLTFGPPVVPTRREQPLWFIPVVPFNPWDLSFRIETPPIMPMIDGILADYLVSADYHNLLHQCGAGTVLHGAGFEAAEWNNITHVGGGTGICSQQIGSTLQYVQTNGQAGAELRQARFDLHQDMAAAVGRLMLSQQKNVAESAAGLELQFSGEDANLQQIAGTTAMALEEAARIHAWWMGTAETPEDVEGVEVDLNDQFVVSKMDAQEVLSLITATDMGGMTDRDLYFGLQHGERLDPSTTFEQWSANRQKQTGGTAGGVDIATAQKAIAALKQAQQPGANGTVDLAAVASATAALDALMAHGDAVPPPDAAMRQAA